MDKYKLFIKSGDKEVYAKRLFSKDSKDYYKFIAEVRMAENARQFIVTQYIMSKIVSHYVRNKKYNLINMKRYCRSHPDKEYEYKPKCNEDSIDIVDAMLDLNDESLDFYSITLKKFEEIIEIKSNGIISTNVPLDKNLLELIHEIYF